MFVKREKLKEAGSCTFCDRGKLNKSGYGLDFPYNEVTYVKGNSVSVFICDDCLKELLEKTKK